MRFMFVALPCALALSACSSSSQPEAPKPPQIGMANPAAVYCEQKGGTRVPVQSPQGVRTECKLPGGEVIEEWDLWRREIILPAVSDTRRIALRMRRVLADFLCESQSA